VVIVDDERAVATALMRELRVLGVNALVVEDPRETEAVVARTGAVAVICDKRMPQRSGVEVLTALKTKFPKLSRCLLTGSLSELTTAELAAFSPVTLVGKPWSRRDLENLVRSLGVVG
jgi:DNA-binding NtrC family response regulator